MCALVAASSFLLCVLLPASGQAEASAARVLTLGVAKELARSVSPELVAAREAILAASGREEQAAAFPNPSLTYSHEETSLRDGESSENIVRVSQPLAFGRRASRREVARRQREAAQVRLRAAEAQLDFEVSRAYALAFAAAAKLAIAEESASAFEAARAKTVSRFKEGDVSGYSRRRIELETARFGAIRAQALGERRRTALDLAALLENPAEAAEPFTYTLPDTLPILADSLTPSADLPELRELALRSRPELRIAELEARAAEAQGRLAVAQRIPKMVAGAGFKRESSGGGSGNGFVLDFSIPIGLWDRRSGAVAAAKSKARRRQAELRAVRRETAAGAERAWIDLRTVSEQLAAFPDDLVSETRSALRAIQVAYAEGEVSLLEWLDAVRAYHEARSTFAELTAEHLIRREALERALGAPIFGGH